MGKLIRSEYIRLDIINALLKADEALTAKQVTDVLKDYRSYPQFNNNHCYGYLTRMVNEGLLERGEVKATFQIKKPH